METVQPKGWSRRKMIGGLALLAAAIGVPLAAIRLDLFNPDDAPSERQRDMMRNVSQHVIPATDTPGAGDVGTGDFVLLALAHGLEKSRLPLPGNIAPTMKSYLRNDGSLDHAAWLEGELDRLAGGDFSKVSAAEQIRFLTALDTEAYAPEKQQHPWRAIKSLILMGYYTSEVGGSKELRFELVPGSYNPDVIVKPETRAYSSDWTAVDFG